MASPLKSSKPHLLALACVVTSVIAAASLGIIQRAEAASPSTPVSGKSERVRVTFFLEDNSFLGRIPGSASAALTSYPGTADAARAARQSKTRASKREFAAAAHLDAARNRAISSVQRAAVPVVTQSNEVQAKIEEAGGEVLSAIPIPNQVTALVPESRLHDLASLPGVRSVSPSKAPVWMNAPIDGSAVWHAAGFTGNGTSADGNGAPDAVVFDQGIRTTHDAFKSRTIDDCPTCDGTGPSRIISPVGRTDFVGTKHANTIASNIGGTALSFAGSAGMAYGLDKLYDNFDSDNPYLWDLGIESAGDPALGGSNDLPEVINYSAGVYEDNIDLDPATYYFDALEDRFGILQVVSAGNCGVADPGYTNCGDGPHRVSSPGTNFNVLTMGGLDTTTPFPDTSGFIPWEHTSPGPTFAGRKKPDLIAPVFGTAGTPSAIDDHTTTSVGLGTSFAAPIGASGALLLASTGVYNPTAQKAIMINSATPVAGQTYWSPRSGWGAINMAAAFPDRGNYVEGTVTGSDNNGVRFYSQPSLAVDDRTTLVWNRRTDASSILNPGYRDLTNLDLSQFDASDPDTPTATGGSDAADTEDNDPVATPDNPMPGNGTDGGDNVEQIRSTATGTQIVKVKALTPIDGATSEPFSLAGHHALTALENPVPEVTLSVAPTITSGSGSVQVTASVENTSSDLTLKDFSVDLNLPGGVSLFSGNDPSLPYDVGAGQTTTVGWIVTNNTPGMKTFSATASGTAYGETFTGSDSTTLDVDSDPPSLTFSSMPTWSTTVQPFFQWAGNDSQSAVDFYDVEKSVDGGAFTPLLTASEQTSISVPGAEGQNIRLRIRATDLFGNATGWTEVGTTIDAVGPVASLGLIDASKKGIRNVPLIFSNAGSPVTAKFTFADKVGGRTGTATNGQVVTYTNNSSSLVFASISLVVTDALGRQATAQETLQIEPRLGPSGLKFKSAKRSGKSLVIKGTTSKSFSGKVTVVATRIGKKGTKRVSRSTTVKKGAYKVTLKLKAGRYKFVASTPKTSKFSATTITNKLKIK